MTLMRNAHPRRALGPLVAIAALTASAPGAAAAQDRGLPLPCGAVAILDAAGDQQGVGTGRGPDSLDITHAFLNTVMQPDGKWRTTVNIGITNLTRAIPPESVTRVVSYTFEFKQHNQDIIYVRARTDGTEVTYHYIYGERVGATELTFGGFRTEGRFVEGPNGIVEIVLPDAIATPGTVFEDVYFMVSDRHAGWAPYADAGYRYDAAPDEEARAGLMLKLEECPPPLRPASAQAPPPAGPAPARPSVKFGRLKVSAKKARLSLEIAGATLHKVTVTLSKGSRRLATARAARLGVGALKVTFKLPTKLRKGAYRVRLEATAHGRRFTARQTVTVRNHSGR
jgi:hypothetical protein